MMFFCVCLLFWGVVTVFILILQIRLKDVLKMKPALLFLFKLGYRISRGILNGIFIACKNFVYFGLFPVISCQFMFMVLGN